MNETGKRIISGVSLATLFIGALLFDWQHFVLLYIAILFFAYLTLMEYISLCSRGEEGGPFKNILLLFSFAAVTMAYAHYLNYVAQTENLDGIFGVPARYLALFDLMSSGKAIFGVVFFTMLLAFYRQVFYRPLMGAVLSVSSTVLGLVYIAIPGSHLLLTLALPSGIFYIWFVCTVNFMTDTGAYFGGKFFGSHPVGFKVSPNKTYEGYIAGTIIATLCGLLVFFLWGRLVGTPPLSFIEALVLSPVLSLIAVLGDLSESAIKRDARRKDSNALIPGHGGAFDLLDALFLSMPAMYYYVVIKLALQSA